MGCPANKLTANYAFQLIALKAEGWGLRIAACLRAY
jgi:hypothetical protein